MRPPKIVLESRPAVRFRLPDKAIALWDKTLKGPTEGATISILTHIGHDPIYGPGYFVSDLTPALKEAGRRPLTVNLNSPGGDAFEGITIFNLLVDYPAPITVNILGEAASAASVIAMAGDRIRMYQGSLMMIHSSKAAVMAAIYGNSKEIRHTADELDQLAEVLDRLDGSVAELYANRTGNSVDDVLALMRAETWMKPDEAVERGFANEVVKQQSPAKAKQSAALAASGIRWMGKPITAARIDQISLSSTSPGVSGHSLKGNIMQTSNERIQALENSLAARVARMKALDEESEKSGNTFDAAQLEEFKTLDSEVNALEVQLQAARRTADLLLARAKPVPTMAGTEGHAAAEARVPANTGIRVERNVEKGTAFTRMAIAMYLGGGNPEMAAKVAQQNKRWMSETPDVHQFLMTAVGAGTTTGSGWADDMVYRTNLVSEFVELLRAQTILDRIPGLNRVPFNIRLGTQTSGTTAFWTGQARAIPLSKIGTGDLTMDRHKLAALTAITEELARDSSPGAEAFIRNDMLRASRELLDTSFIDPDRAEVSGVSPASITNGVTPVTPSGTNAAALRHDIATLFNLFTVANQPKTGGVWIMTETIATAVSMMMNALGQPEFPTMNPNGGMFFGYPAIVSQSAYGQTSPGGGLLIFAIPREILIADDGEADVSVSREASLEMSDAPANRSDTGTGAQLVSLWQTDSIGLRVRRFVTFKKRRASAVNFILDPLYAV